MPAGPAPATLTAPAAAGFLGVPGPLAHGLLLTLSAGLFGWILWRRLALLRAAAPAGRLDRPGLRLRRLLVVGFGQSRQPRYPVAGTLHILVFFGFLVLLLRSLTLLGEGFVAGFVLPGLGGRLGAAYGALEGWTALVVLGACATLAARRSFARPARYHDRLATRSHGAEAYLILGLIATLMLADAAYEGSALAAAGRRSAALPLASLVAAALGHRPGGSLTGAHVGAFWLHNVVLCGFACYLPLSKHFHVLTALPNVYLGKLPPQGRLGATRPTGDGAGGGAESCGVRRLEDFTWKHLLDFYSCTDCGRCSDACPAYGTGAPLSPRMISVKLRDEAYATHPVFGRPRAGERPPLVGGLVRDEELWACTTCGACEETCPVTIEYVDKIVGMRRHLVEEGRVPAGVQKALADLEKRGNPYGRPARRRGDWRTGPDGAQCGVRALAPGDRADLCYFTDSGTAFDPRLQSVGRAFGELLAAAGVDCGTLGEDEVDSGHEARRFGEEGLFELLRDRNLEALARRAFARLVTNDPHALNALRNDYGLAPPALHHSQVLDELIAAGRLALGPLEDGRTYAFHDPCYLGRHNGEFDAPRRVLAALPGLRTVELARARGRSACCGGGSLHLFQEGAGEERMGAARVRMAAAAGADVIVTACPFCLLQLEDAVKASGRAGRMEVLDLAELVRRALRADAGAEARAGPRSRTGE